MSKLSPSEKKGLLVLSSILLIAFIIQSLQPYYVKEDLYDYTLQDSIFQAISSDTTKEIIKESATPKPKTKQKKATKKSTLSPHNININIANQQQLEKLPRIGPATAKNIMEYREKNGSFKSIDELLKVKRIGPKTLELIRPFITIK